MKKKTSKIYKAEKELKIQAALGTKKVARLLCMIDNDMSIQPNIGAYIGYLGEVSTDNELGLYVITFTNGDQFLVFKYQLEFL